MKCYTYYEKTKEYKDIATAQLDPLETKKAGKDVWILPANATFEEPPVFNKNHKTVIWNSESWEIVSDWRKCRLYNPKTKEETSVTEIGKDKPEGYYPILQTNSTPYFDVEVRDDGVYFVDRPMTKEEKTAEVEAQRKDAYKAEVDELHARKTRKVICETWTAEDEAEYVKQVKAISESIAKRYPYPE